MTYDYIIFNSNPVKTQKVRGVGSHRVANEIRKLGKTCLVVDYTDYITIADYKEILSYSVGSNTIAIGFSVGWMMLIEGSDQYSESRTFRKYEGDERRLDRMIADNYFKEVVELTKKLYPVKIFIGGPKALYFKDEHYIDYVFHGYSENMIVDFVRDIDNCPREMNYDFKSMNGDFDFKTSATYYEPNSYITSSEILQIEFSRGCKFKCKFCNYPMIGDKRAASNIKDVEVFKDELTRNYEMFGVTKYSISDDTFNDSIEKVEMFAKAVSDLPFDPTFWAYIRADLLVTEPEQIPLLHEMGLTQCWMGIETFTQAAGKSIGKGMDPDRIKSMLYDAKKVWARDVIIQIGLILGLPFESTQDFEKNTVEFLQRKDCPVDWIGLNPLIINAPALTESYDFLYLSEFDINHEKYGYTFPHQDDPSKVNYWIKDDDTDIHSFEEALELVDFYFDYLNSFQTQYLDMFKSAMDFKPFMDYNKIRSLTESEQIDLMNKMPDPIGFMESNIRNKYIKPLKESLRS